MTRHLVVVARHVVDGRAAVVALIIGKRTSVLAVVASEYAIAVTPSSSARTMTVVVQRRCVSGCVNSKLMQSAVFVFNAVNFAVGCCDPWQKSSPDSIDFPKTLQGFV
ncbi:hypothetical protein C1H46_037056 [Malus baccata]|uniref:Uncharacterized protein n=1 Tax=Malus baccata TaxID=106549 RepID=A0A540KT68_MALBA|nr:hypothetical protein C1H46_037056 [Malus baccata]